MSDKIIIALYRTNQNFEKLLDYQNYTKTVNGDHVTYVIEDVIWCPEASNQDQVIVDYLDEMPPQNYAFIRMNKYFDLEVHGSPNKFGFKIIIEKD